MDYYRLNNIKADTDMRDSISKGDEKQWFAFDAGLAYGNLLDMLIPIIIVVGWVLKGLFSGNADEEGLHRDPAPVGMRRIRILNTRSGNVAFRRRSDVRSWSAGKLLRNLHKSRLHYPRSLRWPGLQTLWKRSVAGCRSG